VIAAQLDDLRNLRQRMEQALEFEGAPRQLAA
jgi:hypothetical protein